MNSKKVGRNDPCPCGSGKKYKRCCGRRRRARRRARVMQADRGNEMEAPAHDMADLVPTLLAQLSQEDDQDPHEIVELVEHMAAFQALEEEIEAAVNVLEEHRAEFESLVQDPDKAVDRVRRLFAEERFAHLRFTADDIHRAFKEVGYPSSFPQESDEDMGVFDEAVFYIVEDKERAYLARQLMMLLPEYVAAERYMDAWLIQYTAWQTIDEPGMVNGFLLQMFLSGYYAWSQRIAQDQMSLLREIGVDVQRFQSSEMSPFELQAEIDAYLTDPEKSERVRDYWDQHELVRAEAVARAQELEQKMISLLEREDAHRLYLTAEEMDPWVESFFARLEALESEKEEQAPDPSSPNPLYAVALDISQKMADEVFVPARVDRLRQELQVYQRELSAAQETQAVAYAFTAHGTLDRIEDPGQNRFLVALCYYSLRDLLVSVADKEED